MGRPVWKDCGWQKTISAENKDKLLSWPLVDSDARDLRKVARERAALNTIQDGSSGHAEPDGAPPSLRKRSAEEALQCASSTEPPPPAKKRKLPSIADEVRPSSERESAGTCVLVPEGAAEPPAARQCGPPSPTPPPPPQGPNRLSRQASSSSDDESIAICEDPPDEEDLDSDDEQTQVYLARKRRAEGMYEAFKGAGWGELAWQAYDHVMEGKDQEVEGVEVEEEDMDEAAKAPIISTCDSIPSRGDEDSDED